MTESGTVMCGLRRRTRGRGTRRPGDVGMESVGPHGCGDSGTWFPLICLLAYFTVRDLGTELFQRWISPNKWPNARRLSTSFPGPSRASEKALGTRFIALKGHGSIGQSASPHGL